MYDIIEKQIANKHVLIRQVINQNDIIGIEIKDNKLHQIVYPQNSPMEHRYLAYHKLIQDTLNQFQINDIIFNINIADIPRKGMLNFCRPIDDNNYFLIPNHRFSINDISLSSNELYTIKSDNNQFKDWDTCLKYMNDTSDDFKEKISKIYSNFKFEKGRMSFIQFVLDNRDIADMYVYGGHPSHKWKALNNKKLETFLIQENLGGTEFKAFFEHSKYKYVMYLDGNTLSDRMRLLLGTRSVIFRLPSRFEEFYSHMLHENENYILIRNYNEIPSFIRTFEQYPEIAENMISNNINFLNTHLKHRDILDYTAQLLNGLSKTS